MKQKVFGWHSLFPDQYFVVTSLCYHNFSFLIEFTLTRLLLHNYYHNFWVDWFRLRSKEIASWSTTYHTWYYPYHAGGTPPPFPPPLLAVEQIPKYLGIRGESIFFRHVIFFRGWFELYTNSYMLSPNSFWVIFVVSNIVFSVAQSVLCDSTSLRVIFKLPLREADDIWLTLLIPRSVLCCHFALLS